MFSRSGCIVAVRRATVCVQLQPVAGCGACSGAVFSEQTPQRVTVAVDDGRRYQVGEQVRVNISPSALMWSAWLYLFPLGGFLLGAGAGTMIFRHELAAFATAVAALLVGLLAMRWRYLHQQRRGLLRPVLSLCGGEPRRQVQDIAPRRKPARRLLKPSPGCGSAEAGGRTVRERD